MNARFAIVVLVFVVGAERAVVANTDAITFVPLSPTVQAVGYINGAVAWSFVPKTDIVVTWLGFMNLYAGTSFDPLRIGLWDANEKQIVSYTVGDTLQVEETDTNYVAYGKIAPVLLQASQQYFITSDRGEMGTQVVGAFVSDLSKTDVPHFAMAPELEYAGWYDFSPTTGVFVSRSATNAVIVGPMFRYELASVFEPRLSVRAVQDGLVLSWPASSANFVLESTTRIEAAAWDTLTDAPEVNSDGYSITYHPPDAVPRFFRLRLE